MGYTHYWRKSAAIPAANWAAITADLTKVIAAAVAPLLHEYDEPGTAPLIDHEQIWLNGAGDDGHETFALDRATAGFGFCKTARKPYDLVVCAALIIIESHSDGIVEVTSDGEKEEWKPALDLVTQTLGEGYGIPSKV